MFEDINQHRAAVAEQIQKACEIGFTGNELEKAHKVGDVHPNGKWVWTQLPSGKYDWRVRKQTSAGSGTAAPSTAQKTDQSDKTWDKISDFSKMNSVEAQLVAQWGNFVRRKDSSYMSTMRQLLQQKFPNVAQWKQTAPNTDVSKITAVDVDGNEIAVLDLSGGVNIPKLQTFMDKCSEVKKESKQQTVKMPATLEEAEKMGEVNDADVNAYKVPMTLKGCKWELADYRGGSDSNYSFSGGKIESCRRILRNAFNRKVGDGQWDYKTEKEKFLAIKVAADKLATEKAIEKRILKVQSDLNKIKKQFLSDTKQDFTEQEVQRWLNEFNTAEEPAAVVRNTWQYAMGRIGSTSATIQVGKGKDKPFTGNRWDNPSWRPIGMMKYSVPNWNHTSRIDVAVPIQSWDDVRENLDDTESFTLYLYKHPKQ